MRLHRDDLKKSVAAVRATRKRVKSIARCERTYLRADGVRVRVISSLPALGDIAFEKLLATDKGQQGWAKVSRARYRRVYG